MTLVKSVQQSVYFVDQAHKIDLLARLVHEKKIKRALVLSRTKYTVNQTVRELAEGGIVATAIHGNKSQTARQQALNNFTAGRVRCLVATDVVLNYLDLETVPYIFDYDLPTSPEVYMQHIERSGFHSKIILFCDETERLLLKNIEALMGQSIPVINYPSVFAQNPDPSIADPEKRERPREAAERPKKRQSSPRSAHANAKKREEPQISEVTESLLPETRFYRPNPMAGDRIMDATARLLAPRSASNSRPEIQYQPKKKKKTIPTSANSTAKTKQLAGTRGQRERGHQGAASAVVAKASRPRRSQSGSRRPDQFTAPVKSGQVKDSTEQKSLMKPFYLNI